MQGEAPTAMRVATTCRNDGKAIEATKTRYNKKIFKKKKKKSDFILNLRYVVMFVYEYIIKILLL